MKTVRSACAKWRTYALFCLMLACDEANHAAPHLLSCDDNSDCARRGLSGHACIREDEKAASDPAVRQPGYCADACDDALCEQGEECTRPDGVCEAVRCGRLTECPSGQYCEMFEHTCREADGMCGADLAPCPQLKAWLGGAHETECAVEPREVVGTCAITQHEQVLPSLDVGELKPMRLLSPETGDTFAVGDDPEFRFEGPSSVHFVLVGTGSPVSKSELFAQVIWGAALPRTSSVRARSVRWSEGSSIDAGVWKRDVKPPPEDITLFAVVLGVQDDAVIAATTTLTSFRVGRAWPAPGQPCDAQSDDWGRVLPSASLAACGNPSQPLACLGPEGERTCRTLCTGFECADGARCVLAETEGVRYCL